MPSVLRNEKMAACDLENGMELYVGADRMGYTLGEVQLQGNATWVDLYQGQPAKLVGSRLARLEGMLTIPCLEMTPETHALASGIGSLVATQQTTTGIDGAITATLTGTTAFWLPEPGVTSSSIVVKSADNATTYVEDTDYTVEQDAGTQLYGVARKADGAIASGAVVNITYTYSETKNTPYLFFGAAREPIHLRQITLAKKNPGAVEKPWHVIQIWEVESKSSYSLTWNQDSQSWMALNLELGLLSDELNTEEHHDLCPLWMETWQDEFDIHDLPPVPTSYQEVM